MDALQHIVLAIVIGYLFWVRSKDKKEIETYKLYSDTMILIISDLKREVEELKQKIEDNWLRVEIKIKSMQLQRYHHCYHLAEFTRLPRQ